MDEATVIVDRPAQQVVVADRTVPGLVVDRTVAGVLADRTVAAAVLDRTVSGVVAVGQQGPAGAQGPAGPAGSITLEFPFAFGDATPATVTTATANKVIYGVQVHITTAFDGVGAALVVGDAGQADRLMAAQENDPFVAGSYTTSPAHAYGVGTNILLGITAGAGATQGAGILIVSIQH